MTRTDLPTLTDEMLDRIERAPPITRTSADSSARGLLMDIQAQITKRDAKLPQPGRYYVRLSIDRWRILRRALPSIVGLDPLYAKKMEDEDMMPGEFPDGGIQLFSCPVAIRGSKLSMRLTKDGRKPIEFL